MPKAPKAHRSNLVKRACDACKVRKIKCSETSPCSGCVASGIACTFIKLQSTRGPRSLRAKTIQKIAETQEADGDDNHAYATQQASGPHAAHASNMPGFDYPVSLDRLESDIPALVQALEIYRLRLYPVWPIVDVDKLQAQLVSEPDLRSRLLATSIRLAAIAQLRLDTGAPDDVPRTSLEDNEDNVDLNGLRVAFFLHIYHENQTAGGGRSLLYLRQALTIAQMMRLDRAASYVGLPDEEQQMRRRILWLLFVTERGVAMLHKMPVILKPNIAFPSPGEDDQAHVLPAFLKLINLFWTFDESGIFEILQNSDSDMSNIAGTARGCLDLLQCRLLDSATDFESSNDVQRADIFVTRQWMRAVLWRAAMRFGMPMLASSPIRIAREFLSFVSDLPKAAIEAHGLTIEFKTYDIATAVIDAVTSNIPIAPADHPQEVLQGLQKILSSSRGGNKGLLAALYLKMAAIAPQHQAMSMSRVEELIDDGVQQQAGSTPNASAISPSAWAELEDILANHNVFRAHGTEKQYTLDQMNQQGSWPPIDFGTPLIRTPSPMTRTILEQLQANGDDFLASQTTAWNEPIP